MKTNASNKRFITEAEFCERYSFGRTTAWRMRRDGDGPAWHHIGARILYDVDVVEMWFATHRAVQPSAVA